MRTRFLPTRKPWANKARIGSTNKVLLLKTLHDVINMQPPDTKNRGKAIIALRSLALQYKADKEVCNQIMKITGQDALSATEVDNVTKLDVVSENGK